jgi:hypothetical protein
MMTTFPFVFTEQETSKVQNLPKIRLLTLTALLSVLALMGCVIRTSQLDLAAAERLEAFKVVASVLFAVFSLVAYRLMPPRAFVVILMLMLSFGGYGLYLLNSFS